MTKANAKSDQGHPDRDVNRALADNLRERAAAAYMYACTSGMMGESFEPSAFQAYRDQLLADCGGPVDPLEGMLIETIALAYHNIGRLFVRSSTAEHHDVAAAYAAAATRLTAEFRRATLALQDYRAKSLTRLGVMAADAADDEDQTAAGKVA